MGTTGSLFFSGISSYSSDFQSILQRAVSIAQLPIKSLQNDQTDNLGKKQALIALNPAVASVGSAVTALGTLASNQGVTASSSDSSIVSVANTGATSPGTYVISEIQSLAKAASETSLLGKANPATTAVSSTGHVDLVVGSNTFHIDLTGKNNLNSLRDAINAAGAGVSATVLTIGASSYLAVNAANTGATTLKLNDVPNPVALTTNTGSGSETSLATYVDTTTAPVSSSGKVDLVVGSTTYHLDVTGNNNLTGLQDAINNAGAGITASISGGAGAYSLTITAAGPTTLKLNDLPTPTNLISNTNQGADADFKVNGVHVTRSSNVNSDVIPGLSFTLQNTTVGSVSLSLTTSSSPLSYALQTFVNNYNTLVDQVTAQVGPAGGPLGGDVLIREVSDDIRQLTSYWNPSGTSVHSLSDLGVTFDDLTGHMTFDQTAVTSFSSSQISDAFKFFGSANSGFAALANNFTQLSDPASGMIRLQEDGYDTTNQRISDQIATLNDRATQIQNAMTAKLQAADALVALLQSQQSVLTASVSSLNYVLYGKNTTANGF